MPIYSVRYAGTDAAPFEFEADDASSALIIACRVAGKRDAELWKAGNRLCALPTDPEQAWVPAWFVRLERAIHPARS